MASDDVWMHKASA